MNVSSLVVAVGHDHNKNSRLVRFGETLARAGGLKLRLLHVYEPPATSDSLAAAPLGFGVGPHAEESVRNSERSEIQAATERLRFLAASVAADVQVSHEVAVGEVLPSVQAFVERHTPCMLLVGAESGLSSSLPAFFSPTLPLIEGVRAPVIALPQDADVGLDMRDVRLLLADDLRAESSDLLATAIDFVRTFGAAGKGQIVDTHVKNLTLDMFSASLAEVFVTALGRRPDAGHSPTSLVASVRPALKRMINERARRIFARKGHEGVTFHSMVLKGDVVKALRAATLRVGATMLVFGRHHALHKTGDRIGHMPSRQMLGFRRPVLIVPV